VTKATRKFTGVPGATPKSIDTARRTRIRAVIPVYAGLLVAAALTVAPFALGLLTSFTSAQQFATGAPLSLPDPPTLANYTALGAAGFGRALAVTAVMAAVITL